MQFKVHRISLSGPMTLCFGLIQTTSVTIEQHFNRTIMQTIYPILPNKLSVSIISKLYKTM